MVKKTLSEMSQDELKEQFMKNQQKKPPLMSRFGIGKNNPVSHIPNDSIEDLKDEVRSGRSDIMSNVKSQMNPNGQVEGVRIPYPTIEEHNDLMRQNKELNKLIQTLNLEMKSTLISPPPVMEEPKPIPVKNLILDVKLEIKTENVNSVLNSISRNNEIENYNIEIHKQ